MNSTHSLPSRPLSVYRAVCGTLLYPAVVLAVGAGVAVWMCATFIPMLTCLYAELQVRTPFATMLLASVVTFAAQGGLALLVGAILLSLLLNRMRASRTHRFLPVLVLAAMLPLLTGCESTYRSKYDQGYAQASGDSIKRNYWLRQELESRTYTVGDGGRKGYYTLPGPDRAPDGTKLAPHAVTVPIDE